MKLCEIDVLGTTYKVYELPEEDASTLRDKDGLLDWSTHEIIVRRFDVREYDDVSNIEVYRDKVLRHEIIHAFVHESGLAENSHPSEAVARDEEMVDWVAYQFPKLLRAFREAGCI